VSSLGSNGRRTDCVKSASLSQRFAAFCLAASFLQELVRVAKSNSPSLRCLRALGRSFGKICRDGAVSVVASVAGGAEAVAVGNSSDAVRSVGSRPIESACREQCRSAISSERAVYTVRHSQTTRRNRLQRATRSFFALGHILGVSTCWNASTPRPDGFSAPHHAYVDPNLCITVYHSCRDIFPKQKTRDVIDITGLIWLRG
jgi:hypothetical protein